jgi:hypothetical protein
MALTVLNSVRHRSKSCSEQVICGRRSERINASLRPTLLKGTLAMVKKPKALIHGFVCTSPIESNQILVDTAEELMYQCILTRRYCTVHIIPK